uniref:Uncharacterized protein n=1 Tax=viral metagenome TaxID=1070528 RepID=A0A6C0EH13_9ZZZZ
MTKQKNPTSFYRRGTSNPKFGYYSEGNYAIVKPFTQSYFGFLNDVIGVNNANTTRTNQHVKTKIKTNLDLHI